MKDDGFTCSNVFVDGEKKFEDVWISTNEVVFALVFEFGVEIVSKRAALGEIAIELFENVVEIGLIKVNEVSLDGTE